MNNKVKKRKQRTLKLKAYWCNTFGLWSIPWTPQYGQAGVTFFKGGDLKVIPITVTFTPPNKPKLSNPNKKHVRPLNNKVEG